MPQKAEHSDILDTLCARLWHALITTRIFIVHRYSPLCSLLQILFQESTKNQQHNFSFIRIVPELRYGRYLLYSCLPHYGMVPRYGTFLSYRRYLQCGRYLVV